MQFFHQSNGLQNFIGQLTSIWQGENHDSFPFGTTTTQSQSRSNQGFIEQLACRGNKACCDLRSFLPCFRFPCPNCGTTLSLQEELIGNTCKCAACGQEMMVSRPSSPQAKSVPNIPVEQEILEVLPADGEEILEVLPDDAVVGARKGTSPERQPPASAKPVGVFGSIDPSLA